MPHQPKVALVHDDFMQAGGAENLFATIAAMYPQAPIYTSLVDWQKVPSWEDFVFRQRERFLLDHIRRAALSSAHWYLNPHCSLSPRHQS